MLTLQQKQFGQEFINKRDTYKAAIIAGVAKEYAKKIGEQWIEDPEVVEFINSEIEKSAEKTKITRDWIINETKKVLQTSYKPVDKISALNLLDKLLTKVEIGADEVNSPQVVIISDGDLHIL
jgi:hypothetical protein